ncbi:MAG: hypothetical protein ABSH14_14485, partial [Verrucomicrobiia bacterium]
ATAIELLRLTTSRIEAVEAEIAQLEATPGIERDEITTRIAALVSQFANAETLSEAAAIQTDLLAWQALGMNYSKRADAFTAKVAAKRVELAAHASDLAATRAKLERYQTELEGTGDSVETP